MPMRTALHLKKWTVLNPVIGPVHCGAKLRAAHAALASTTQSICSGSHVAVAVLAGTHHADWQFRAQFLILALSIFGEAGVRSLAVEPARNCGMGT